MNIIGMSIVHIVHDISNIINNDNENDVDSY